MMAQKRFSLLFLALALFLLCSLYGKDLKVLLGWQAQEASRFIINRNNNNNESERQAATPQFKVAERKKWQRRLAFSLNDDESEECDVFSGSWVRDEAARSLYREADCPYIPPQLTCEARGRPDTAYQRWRWQPNGCTLPAFDAARMLEALRNKRMLFVGDSLNRGQFMSMCFRVLQRGSLDEGAEKETVTWVSTEEAYGMAFRDMLQWVRDNMDFNTTRVFFTSMSPTHRISEEWGGEPGGNCYNETAMISDTGYWGSDSRQSMMRVIRKILDGDGADVPLTFLNITQLSMSRKDAHTSIYKQQWSEPTAEQLADPKTYADCVHWCLPGLQDTWNELLYSKLFYP
ncbi:Protein trichome birefringence-like 33 [Dichanthelium oligosanthes]|uniref:Protein trichome birefringence-like 33 n=1 Tax=Dichanthelium oligosanthes TaxID=888268 RepID=A0A1E5VHE0_9POAL|nr:Protein trichome birefringence-like 33 [Dichanthelium oligosanthes]